MTDQELSELATRAATLPPERRRCWEPILCRLTGGTARNKGIVEGIFLAAEAAGDTEAAARLRDLAAFAASEAILKAAQVEEANRLLEAPETLDEVEAEMDRIEAGLAKPNDAFEGLRQMEERMRRRAPPAAGEDAA